MEAAGDIATGTLLARAVEPRAGEHHTGGTPGLCLNCGTALIGEHCHVCGQSAHVHRTVGAIGHEIAHGVFHFEGKIWRTLPMLALHPGQLTRRYIDGERARFVSPMAIFLFSVFLMFTVVANLPGWNLGNGDFLNGGLGDGMAKAKLELGTQRQKAQAEVTDLQQRIAEERADTAPDAERIAALTERLGKAQRAIQAMTTAQNALPAGPTVTIGGERSPDVENWFEAKWRHARENPQLLLYKLKNSAYKYSWALIPLSLPFVWLLFPLRRRVGLYDHAVFTTYSLSFMSLLVVVLAVLDAIGVPEGYLYTAAFLVPPFHIYKQLKGGYALSRAGGLWRTGWLLLFISCFVLPIFASLLLYLGFVD